MPVAASPGPDPEQRLHEAVLFYLKASDRGQAPSREELLARYPDLAAELTTFLADESCLDPLLAPLRRLGPSSPVPGEGVSWFGDYELLGELGRGGMGVVYKARQKSPNRLVALKMIRAGEWATF